MLTFNKNNKDQARVAGFSQFVQHGKVGLNKPTLHKAHPPVCPIQMLINLFCYNLFIVYNLLLQRSTTESSPITVSIHQQKQSQIKSRHRDLRASPSSIICYSIATRRHLNSICMKRDEVNECSFELSRN